MEWKDLLIELIDTVKNTSEAVWEIARRQAVVIGVQNLIGSLVSIVILFLLIRAIKWFFEISKREIEKDRYDDEWWKTSVAFPIMMSFVLLVCSIVSTIAFLLTGIGMLINPDFYAIKILIGLISR